MNEIKQTLNILKNRWPEVTLIIGLWFLHRLIILTLRIYPDIRILIQLVAISLSLFVLVVSTGFLRTVYLHQNERQSFRNMVRTGIHFFWRFLGLGILVGFTTMFFFWLLRITNTADVISPAISGPFIKILLAKLTLLLPAIIIVTDCSISKSFSIMWKVKLLKAKPLLICFLIVNIVLPTLLMLFLPDFWRASLSITWANAIPVLYSVFSHIMSLMISIMAIRFASSLELPNGQFDHLQHNLPPLK